MDKTSLMIAFTAGVFSIFSPCILPLLPLYISFITGFSVEELKQTRFGYKHIKNIFVRMCIFILGFSLIFVIFGASATFLSRFILQNKFIVRIVAGTIIILFGMQIIGILKIPFLSTGKRIVLNKTPKGILGTMLLGVIFGLGWSPCVGPILASILTIAATKGSVSYGVLLLSVYSLGLGIPFLILGLFINWFLVKFAHINRYLSKISLLSGGLVVVIGVLMILGKIF